MSRTPLAAALLFAGALSFVHAEAQKEFTPQQRRWWAFQKVTKPQPPSPKDSAWVRNPIDAFVLAKLEEKGLRPSPPADRATLLRRATLDLTGLAADAGRSAGVRRRRRRPTPSHVSSTGCWLRPATASAGHGTGSTWRAMPTAKASRAMRRVRTSGAIATTSSTPSIATSRTTASCANRSPATNCIPPTRRRWSPPGSTATSRMRATRAT